MRTPLLFLLMASSAISCVAQFSPARLPYGDREMIEADMRHHFSTTDTRFRTNHFVDLEAVLAEFLKRFVDSPGGGLSSIGSFDWARPVGTLDLKEGVYGVFPPQLVGLEDHQVAYFPIQGRPPVKADFLDPMLRRDKKTRALTAFETNAVGQLKGGTNIVTAIEPARVLARGTLTPEQLLVLAPIQAKADCVKCHKCEEGKLLGAFSYAFTRIASSTNTVKKLAIPAMPGR